MNIGRFLTVKCLLSCFLLSASLTVSAKTEWFANSYVLAAAQYSEVDLEFNDGSEPGFTLAVGTQIHPKWYAEIGYSVLAADFDLGELDLNNSALQTGDSAGIDASGPYVALLGKATGESGELFYKLGVMLLDYQSAWINDVDDTCAGAVANTQFCRFQVDESGAAGIVGLGFDFFVGFNSQVRLSAEHIRGKDDVQINTMHLGYRYNF